jgi:hypothetical protein
MAQRIKHCNNCKEDFSTLYRVQYKHPKEWVFVCKECLVSLKKDNPSLQIRWYLEEINQIPPLALSLEASIANLF